MTFDCSILIQKPIDTILSLYTNDDNLKHWQDGFSSITLLEGNKGAVDAKSRFVYQQNKRTLELIETILVNNLPEEKLALYQHKHMENTMRTSFHSVDEQTTKMLVTITYTKFIGFLPKLMAKLFPNMFKKQVDTWLHNFKIFVEEQ